MGVGLLAAAWALGVTIRVDNLARIPDRDLEAARSEAGRIFQESGVDITWVGNEMLTGPGRMTVILVNAGPQSALDAGDVAGSAVRTVSRAYVYCNRIAVVSNRSPVDANVILGRVIAHEIGHLLLPPNSHARVGIMRPQVDFNQVGFNGFTSSQVEVLRRALNGN
jgi:hypothetical protein